MLISDSLTPTVLFYCCSPDLCTDIICNLQDDVSAFKEDDLLVVIRGLTVKDESTLVHCIRDGNRYLPSQYERPIPSKSKAEASSDTKVENAGHVVDPAMARRMIEQPDQDPVKHVHVQNVQ
ncbi:hypothetical protein RRG08_040712 [Elysia crispata]|uniref:Uncharacterized protein n=1 Tax=Elysia crispata TaxID=231223 RepID=A0AAE1BDB1_9GAST|nr:hypothetical protein RRG08_040712 [Elysia crispata]